MSDSHGHGPATHETTAQAEAETHHDAHAVPHDAHHIEAHLRLYWIVGGVMLFFTAFTVFLSYVDFDKWFGGRGWNMVIGMIVATFKVCLVGAIFMHLKGERPTIWRFLYFTAFFFLGLFVLTWLHWWDPIFGTGYNER